MEPTPDAGDSEPQRRPSDSFRFLEARCYVLRVKYFVRGLVPLAALCAGNGWAVEKPRVAVLTFTSSSSETKALAGTIAEQVASELTGSGRIDAIGSSDVALLLGVERQRLLSGCDEQNACMVEVSAALGAPWLLTGNLGRAGKTLRLDVKLLRASDGKAIFRSGESLQDESEVFSAVARLVNALLPSLGVNETTPSGGGLLSAAPWIVAGLGVGATATGAGFLYEAKRVGAQLEDPQALAQYSYTQATRAIAQVNNWNTTGEVLLVSGGVAALGGLAWFLIAHFVPGASVAIVPTGAGLTLTGVL